MARYLGLLAGLLSVSTPSMAAIEVSGAHSMVTDPRSSYGIILMTVSNSSTSADRLISASVQVGDAKLRGPSTQYSVMPTKVVQWIDVEPGRTIVFSPNEYSITIANLKQPLVQGMEYLLTLRFEKAGIITTNVKVVAQARNVIERHDPRR